MTSAVLSQITCVYHDVIINSAGAFIGFGVYLLVGRMVYKNTKESLKIRDIFAQTIKKGIIYNNQQVTFHFKFGIQRMADAERVSAL